MEGQERIIEEGNQFERIFMEIVLELMEQQGLTFTSLGRKAFPDGYKADPVRRFKSMVLEDKTGRIQRITLSDAYLLSKALGREISYMALWAAQRKLEMSLK